MAATVVTLALGIGANTAVFSVIEAALLRALPIFDPLRLVSLAAVSRGVPSGSVAIPESLAWRARTRTLDAIAGYTTREFNLTGVAIPERLAGECPTPSISRPRSHARVHRRPAHQPSPADPRLLRADAGQ
jgi:putative ABC transport system permease protein